jgi:biopolymer transport protein ExbB/TolQ
LNALPEHTGLIGVLLRWALLGAEWVLWLLVLLFFVSCYIISYKVLQFYLLSRKISRREGEILPEKVKKGIVSFEGSSFPSGGESSLTEEYLLAIKRRVLRYLSSGLPFLGTLGANAPFIGLFGTVIGVIQAFHQLGLSEQVQGTRMVMVGIAEALVATGMGLLVAIPAVFAYNYLLKWAQNLAEEIFVRSILPEIRDRNLEEKV